MITSRTHAALDAGIAAALAGIALAPVASRKVRAAAAAAAVFQAGYSALTDYEGGIAPRFSMQQHRGFDVAAASALGVAGAALRSPALLASGAANLAIALFGEAHSHQGVPTMLYPPLDVPKRLARDIWTVDSAIGPGIPVRMTLIRLGSGELMLHSPTRYSAGLQRALETIGPIRHLVAPNSVHWMFVKAWQDAVPETTTYAAPGLRRRGQVRRSGLRIDHDLSSQPPAAWAGEIEQEVIRGGAGFREVAMFHRASGTAVMTDLVQNFEPGKLPWLLRPIARVLGNTTAQSRAPAYLRALVGLGQREKAQAARRVVRWQPDRVVVTHGRVIEEDAAARLRSSLAWLTG